jgi:hypothetical protein
LQVNNCYWADATLARFVLDARIGYLAATLAQVAGVRLWHDQLLYKPPGADVATNAHELVKVSAGERPDDGSITFHQGAKESQRSRQCAELQALVAASLFPS